eukprot:gene655-10361_t
MEESNDTKRDSLHKGLLPPRCWNEEIDKHLKRMEFKQAKSDPCIYTASGGEVFLIVVYVDDIILAGKTEKRMKEFKKLIAEKCNV